MTLPWTLPLAFVTDPAAALERYRDAALALLPPGRALRRDLGSNVARLLTALAAEFARVHVRASELLGEAWPGTARELLPEWEALFGLEPADEGAVTARREALVAQLVARSGQSAPAYQALAAALGWTATITRYDDRLRAGAPMDEGPVLSDDWAHAWLMSVVADAGASAFAVLEAAVQRVAQSHGVALVEEVV